MAGNMLRIILESMVHCSDMSNGKKVGWAREDGEGWGAVGGGWGYNWWKGFPRLFISYRPNKPLPCASFVLFYDMILILLLIDVDKCLLFETF